MEVWLPLLVVVTHDTLLEADQLQPPPAMTVTLPSPPAQKQRLNRARGRLRSPSGAETDNTLQKTKNATAGRESSVEEALVETYLAGISVRRVEDITEALWGTRVSSTREHATCGSTKHSQPNNRVLAPR